METIENIRIFLIESPIKMARLQVVGHVKNTVKRVIVEMISSSGLIGWGEAAPWEVFTGTPEGAFSALDTCIRPHLIGNVVVPNGAGLGICVTEKSIRENAQIITQA